MCVPCAMWDPSFIGLSFESSEVGCLRLGIMMGTRYNNGGALLNLLTCCLVKWVGVSLCVVARSLSIALVP